MAEYQRKDFRYLCKGLGLAYPSDLQPEGRYPILKNVRVYSQGEIRARAGLSAINSSAITGAIHSVRRLNDDVGPTLATPLQAYARLIGAGTKLYSDNAAHNAFSEIDAGYSGNPLFINIIRPEQSPEPWAYVGDSARLRKVRVDGTDYQWGITPPNAEASVALGGPIYTTIDDFEAGTFGSWSAGGAAAGALTNVDRVAAVAISQILYDTGTTGWATVNPASMAQIVEGCFLTTSASAETVKVQKVTKAVTNTTIASISYDTGTSGLCTIQLTAQSGEVVRDTLLRNTTRTENVRVLAVVEGPAGSISFRCSTAATFVAGDSISGLDSFRAYFANTHAAAETLSTKMLQLVISGAGVTYVERTVAIDLSTISNRAVQPDDVLNLHVQVDAPGSVTELKLFLDVDSATNDFTRNYYYHAIRPSDLTPALANTLTTLAAQQRILQRQQIDVIRSRRLLQIEGENPNGFLPDDLLLDPVPDPFETIPGDSQWTIIQIKVSDLLQSRVGADASRTLKNVAKLRIAANVTGAITLKMDAWWLGGTYGPDSQSTPLIYRYRYRNRETGEPSSWSPPTRFGIDADRERVVLTPTVSSDAQVNLIDWIRKGGTLVNYHYVGTQPNAGTFNDDFPDSVVQELPVVLAKGGQGSDTQGELADLSSFQPFPVIDAPRSGTCGVKGTEVTWATGDTFNTSWVRGNQIIINNVPYTLHASPTSTTRLSLEEDAGSQTGVAFNLPDPVKQGQYLNAYWYWNGDDNYGPTIFGVREGTLYWTNPNQPGLAKQVNQIEVTGGSETLMAGGVYDGHNFICSSERMYEIRPTAEGFFVEEVANSIGLYARWAVYFGPLIYFLGRDGRIYASEGGQPVEVSQDLGPLLPHDGQAGMTVNGILPPDFTQGDKLRFSLADGLLYFDFQDTGGGLATLILDTKAEGWFYDSYTPNVLFHYAEEGRGVHATLACGADGKLYQVSGTADGATAISAQVRTPSIDLGDARAQKLFGDILLDFDADNATLTVTPGFNNHAATLTAATPTNASRGQTVIDLASGAGQLARNIDLDVAWSSTTATPKLYAWSPSYLPRPDDTYQRYTDWDDAGYFGAKYWQGIEIEADTSNVNRTIQVRYIAEDGTDTLGATLVVQHNGRCIRDYSFAVPFYAYQVRLVPAGSAAWQLYRVKYYVQPAPELGTVFQTPFSSHGLDGYFHLTEIWLAHMSTADLMLSLFLDGSATAASTYPLTNSGGLMKKDRIKLAPTKCRTIQYQITSAAKFRIHKPDSEVLLKAWGSSGPYNHARLFGGENYATGAEV